MTYRTNKDNGQDLDPDPDPLLLLKKGLAFLS
jgi:hypothetical protein